MFVVEKKESAKTKKSYVCLAYVVGNKKIIVTFDKIVIMKVLNWTFEDIDSMSIGEVIEVK